LRSKNKRDEEAGEPREVKKNGKNEKVWKRREAEILARRRETSLYDAVGLPSTRQQDQEKGDRRAERRITVPAVGALAWIGGGKRTVLFRLKR